LREASQVNQQQELLEQPVLDFAGKQRRGGSHCFAASTQLLSSPLSQPLGDIRDTLDDLRPYESLWQQSATHGVTMKRIYTMPLAKQPDPTLTLADVLRASASMTGIIKDLPPDASAPRAMAAKVVAEMQVWESDCCRLEKGGVQSTMRLS
jgi:hypothetical protein